MHGRRARARAAAVGGGGAADGAGVLVRDPGRPVQGAVERAIEARRDHEERLVEEEQRVAHLVEGRRALHAQRGGAPQQRDLLAQPAPDLGVLVGRDALVVEPVEEGEDAPQRHEHRASPRLGRVRREHEADGEVADERLVALRRVLAQQSPHGLLDGALRAPGAGRPGTLAHAADALLLLGQVGQVEVEAEGLDEVLDLLVGRAPRGCRAGSAAGSGCRCCGCRSSAAARARRGAADSSPACSAMTWPSSEPSSLTSRESGSRAREDPMPAGSARTAGLVMPLPRSVRGCPPIPGSP